MRGARSGLRTRRRAGPRESGPAVGDRRASLGQRLDGAEARGRQAGPAGDILAREPDLIATGRHQAQLPGARLQPPGRAERGHLDLELPDVPLRPRVLRAELVEAVRELDLLHPHPDDDQRAPDEQRRDGERPDEDPPGARVVFTMELLFVRHGSRSSTRSFALRARGFARTSSSSGPRGDGSSSAKPAGCRARNVCFTMRSSPEWKAITPRRPPTSSSAGASRSAWRSAAGSSFTATRNAWNVRVATWRRRGHAARGTAPRTAATRSPVVRSGRRRTIARAIRRACRSSPCSTRIRASSASVSRFTSCAAVSPRVGSRRMSSGSSFWNEKPRSEEHTSELQSLAYLVCRLLLEKKKIEQPHTMN